MLVTNKRSVLVISRSFTNSTNSYGKNTPTNIKNKKLSSQLWLKRQLTDPYVEKARMSNYRCRSAFKLIEMNEKYRFLKKGHTVIDCGAAPGSWTQIAIKEVNCLGDISGDKGKVISIDKQYIYPIKGATIFSNMDFTDESSQLNLREALGEKSVANIVLSDMAPKATGIRELDTENMMILCYSVFKFAIRVTENGGTVLVKLWQCGQAKKLELDISKFYENVKFVKPQSSRSDSAEIFLLGRHFKGITQ